MDENLLRALLKEQHPDLADLPLEQVPGGWDNQLWRLGEQIRSTGASNAACRRPTT